ncbi:MAG: hypothetical protein WDW36_003286 [Sanguina aurantia]
MSLIVICGQPCAGKSRVAAALLALLEAKGVSASVVDEPSFGLTKTESYEDNVHEKNTRAKLKSAVDSKLSKRSVTILDTLNNIKGYRYELWCIARGVGVRYFMVHIDTPVATCRAWNSAREGDTYSVDVFEDLAGRFERPDGRNRWDSPLFTLSPDAPAPTEERAALLGPAGEEEQHDASPTFEGTLQALVSAVTDDHSRASFGVKQAYGALQPTLSTSNPVLLGTNVLHEIDQAAQEVVLCITEAQANAGGAAAGSCSFANIGRPLDLPHVISLAELRRHKRGFLKLATKTLTSRLVDPMAAKRLFVDYLRDSLGLANQQ